MFLTCFPLTVLVCLILLLILVFYVRRDNVEAHKLRSQRLIEERERNEKMRIALDLELSKWLSQLGLQQLEDRRKRQEIARQLGALMIASRVLRPEGGCNPIAFRKDQPSSQPWNMQYNDKAEIKGDFNVDARGASVLLAKDQQAQSLTEVFSERCAYTKAATRHKACGI